nr:MAG TPA: tail fiber protein [Bacteriophage sp.]
MDNVRDYKARVEYTVTDNTQTVYSFSFPYLRKKFVMAYVIHEDDTIANLQYGVDYTINNFELTLSVPLKENEHLVIYRQTTTKNIIQWNDGSILLSKDMNVSDIQQLHLQEEHDDFAKANNMFVSSKNFELTWDALGHRITNVKDPKDSSDVVTKHYMESVQNGFVQQNTALANTATEAAGKAKDSADMAKKWAMSPVSPDGVVDINSPTGYTQSAKIWAALSKEYAGLSKFKLPIGYYNSVAEMRKSETAIVGRPCVTLGYYEPNDGGGAVYVVRQKKETDVENGSIVALDNGNVGELLIEGAVNVKQFGAKGDGTTDDTAAIQNAINAIPKTGGILYFPPGKYIQGDGTGLDYQPGDTTYSEPTNRDIRYIFDSYDHLTISGYGAVIEANINNPSTEKHAGLVFTNCTNIIIKGLTYDGRLDKRPKTILADGSLYNKQHGIDIRGYNENITLIDVTCTRCMMDGFFIGGLWANKELKPTGIRMLNCISTYNYRQGLSVVSADNGEILNCQFSYTGVIKSTAPSAGIDFECDETTIERNDNWIVHNCKFLNNVGTGVAISLASNNIEVTSSYFYNNAMHINCGSMSSISAQFGNNLKISKNTFKIDAAPSSLNSESNSLAFYNAVDIDFFDNTFILYNNPIISIMDLAGSNHSISCLNIHDNKFINAGAISTCYISITDPGVTEVIFDNNYIYNFCWVNGQGYYTAISISAQKGRICNNNIYCESGNNSSGLVFHSNDLASYSDMIITNNIISGYEKKVDFTNAYADLGVRRAKLVINNILSGAIVNMSGHIGWDTIPSAPSPYISSISSVPSFLGQTAIVSGIAYIATGTSSVTDWKQITNA